MTSVWVSASPEICEHVRALAGRRRLVERAPQVRHGRLWRTLRQRPLRRLSKGRHDEGITRRERTHQVGGGLLWGRPALEQDLGGATLRVGLARRRSCARARRERTTGWMNSSGFSRRRRSAVTSVVAALSAARDQDEIRRAPPPSRHPCDPRVSPPPRKSRAASAGRRASRVEIPRAIACGPSSITRDASCEFGLIPSRITASSSAARKSGLPPDPVGALRRRRDLARPPISRAQVWRPTPVPRRPGGERPRRLADQRAVP